MYVCDAPLPLCICGFVKTHIHTHSHVRAAYARAHTHAYYAQAYAHRHTRIPPTHTHTHTHAGPARQPHPLWQGGRQLGRLTTSVPDRHFQSCRSDYETIHIEQSCVLPLQLCCLYNGIPKHHCFGCGLVCEWWRLRCYDKSGKIHPVHAQQYAPCFLLLFVAVGCSLAICFGVCCCSCRVLLLWFAVCFVVLCSRSLISARVLSSCSGRQSKRGRSDCVAQHIVAASLHSRHGQRQNHLPHLQRPNYAGVPVIFVCCCSLSFS